MKPGELHETLSKLLGAKLKPLSTEERNLDLVACVEIYTTIFDTMVEVLTEANIPITNEAMNYLSQQYYDGVLVNGRQELDPEIFTVRAKLENIETKELAILAVILSGTDFAIPVIQEIKKRQ
jgi:hypothetical protein